MGVIENGAWSQTAHFNVLFQSLLIISTCYGDTSLQLQSHAESLSVALEEDALLPCLKPAKTVQQRYSRFRWTKDVNQHTRVIFTWPKTSAFPAAERVQWRNNENGDVTLKKVEDSDKGKYSCEACSGWDCHVVRIINLNLRACRILPPVGTRFNGSAILRCPLNASGFQHNVSWALMKGDKMLKNVASITQENTRIRADGASLISNFTTESQWYRCNYSVNQSQKCFDIRLQVNVYTWEEEQRGNQTALPHPEENHPVTIAQSDSATDIVQEVETSENADLKPPNKELKNGKKNHVMVISVISGIIVAVMVIIAVVMLLRCHAQSTRQRHLPCQPVSPLQPNDSASDNVVRQALASEDIPDFIYEEPQDHDTCNSHYIVIGPEMVQASDLSSFGH